MAAAPSSHKDRDGMVELSTARTTSRILAEGPRESRGSQSYSSNSHVALSYPAHKAPPSISYWKEQQRLPATVEDP